MSPETLTGVVLILLAFGLGYALGRAWPWLHREFSGPPLSWEGSHDQSARLRRVQERWERERDGADQGRSRLFYSGTDRWRRE